MCFVKDDQVPVRCLIELLESGLLLQRIYAANQEIMLGECVGAAVRHVAFASKNFKIEIEDLVQLPVPVVHKARGNDH